MTDYWLSKLFFDLQNPATGAQWKLDRVPILDRYPLSPEVRAAVLGDDVAVLSPLVNKYLLRFYLGNCGMNDAEVISRLRGLQNSEGTSGG